MPDGSENQARVNPMGVGEDFGRAAASDASDGRSAWWRRRRRRMAVLSRRGPALVLGWLLVIVGAILTPTPVPIGIILVCVGLYFLARHSVFARKTIQWLRGRWPGLSDRLNALKPRVGRGIRRFIERTDPKR